MRVEELREREKYRKRLLGIAFKEHYLRWIADDSEDYHEIHEKDGIRLTAPTLTPRILRRVARRYKINRGIRRPEGVEGDPIAEELAKILTEAVPCIKGQPIQARWVTTRKIAEECQRAMQQRCDSHNVRPIVSGVTKLTWFLAPHGWTMFDKLARKAVGVGQKPAADQADEFYEQLSRRQFCNHVETLQAKLNDHGFKDLFAERVIDKFLMLAGLSDSKDAEEVCKRSLRVDQFIYALHERHAEDVRRCADDLATLADDQFMIAD